MGSTAMAEINHQSRNVLPDQQPTFSLCRAIPKTTGGRADPRGGGKSSCGQVSWEGAFLNRRFRAEITGTFGKGRPREERPDDQTAATGGAGRKVWGLRTKPECPLVSEALCSRLYSRSRILGCGGWTSGGRSCCRSGQKGLCSGHSSGRFGLYKNTAFPTRVASSPRPEAGVAQGCRSSKPGSGTRHLTENSQGRGDPKHIF